MAAELWVATVASETFWPLCERERSVEHHYLQRDQLLAASCVRGLYVLLCRVPG